MPGPQKSSARDGGSLDGKVRTYFCPNCGSTVYWKADRLPDFIAVAVGLFALFRLSRIQPVVLGADEAPLGASRRRPASLARQPPTRVAAVMTAADAVSDRIYSSTQADSAISAASRGIKFVV